MSFKVIILCFVPTLALNWDYDKNLRCAHNCYRDYSGRLKTTITGKRCRQWTNDDIIPQLSDYTDVRQMRSFCRRANFKSLPWCFVESEDRNEWEYCFFFSCRNFPKKSRVQRNLCQRPGYFEYDGKCHTVLMEPVTSWEEGRQACAAESSELASFRSTREGEFIDSLACVAKLVSLRNISNSWNWIEVNETTLNIAEEDWFWCRGYPYSNFMGKCAATLGNNCLVKMHCNNPVETLYPACSYTPEVPEIIEDVPDITWESASAHCKSLGRQLCGFKDLCNELTPNKLNSAAYKSSALPIPGNHWIPIVDEYNDWIYAGDADAKLPCHRHNKLNGPPFCGTNPSVSAQSENSNLCSTVGEVLCCKFENSGQTPNPVKVKVFIRSRVRQDTAFYHFSKHENLTWNPSDLAQWRKYGRADGDLRVITLMSGYIEGIAEDPVYFCKRDIFLDRELPTALHRVSLKPCSNPSWKLNFYLYANARPLQNARVCGKAIHVISRKNSGKLQNRISLEEAQLQPGTSNFTLYIPCDHEIETALHPEVADPCTGRLEKIKDSFGIISSPRHPLSYPKQNILCQWKVSADKNHLLRITFISMDLSEKRKNKHFAIAKEYERFRTNNGETLFNHRQRCKAEYVNITDPISRKSSPNWVDYGHFCGDSTPDSFISTNNSVVIKFQGASSVSGLGYSLSFESIAPPNGLEVINIPPEERVEFTWRNARMRCREIGKDLCTVGDICSIGRPFYGVERGNQWTPILEEFNDWMQIGQARGQTCQRHNPPYGPPLWGVEEFGCDDAHRNGSSLCSFKRRLYCCKEIEEGGTANGLPAPQLLLIKVFTTFQNGKSYYRYIRDGVDIVNDSSIWTFTQRHSADLTRMYFFSHYKRDFRKVVYFCSKSLVPAIGQMQTAYAMLAKSCPIGWKLLFYLYAADSNVPEEDTERIYVGISNMMPHHSRAQFHRFPPMFQGLDSFTFYASTPDFVPSVEERSNLAEDAIQNCSSAMTVVTAPAVIVSPGYPKQYQSSLDCKWRIKLSRHDSSLGAKLRITIEELELENSMDTLLIYDATENDTLDQFSWENGKEFTGSMRGTTLSTNNTFILHFKTDTSVEHKGFKIIAELVNDKCGGDVKNHGSTLMSPNYPRKYKAMLNCTWIITAPNTGYGIEIHFGKFELKNSINCSEDFVTLGPPSKSTQEHKFCGIKNFPPRVQLNESTVHLNFVSGSGQTRRKKGFIFNVFFWPIGNLGGVGILGAQCGEQEIQPWSASSSDSARDRIIGGMEAMPGSWPWVVLLPEATCGGALLNNRWVLTAGHCFAASKNRDGTWTTKKDISNYTVVAGRHHRTASSTGEQVFQIQKIIIHPEYRRAKIGNAGRTVPKGIPLNDIALLKLKQTTVFETPSIAPICLPTQDIAVGETCVIAGWGAKEVLASLSGNSKDSLHYAHVHALANPICNVYEALRDSVTDDMICAGYPGGGVDSCSGDSGGPLMCKVSGQSYQIKGVVSWGRGCGKRNQPGIYTRVWSYYEWISSIIYT